MTFALRPDLQQFVYAQVKAGTFATPEEVVEAGLVFLREQAE